MTTSFGMNSWKHGVATQEVKKTWEKQVWGGNSRVEIDGKIKKIIKCIV